MYDGEKQNLKDFLIRYKYGVDNQDWDKLLSNAFIEDVNEPDAGLTGFDPLALMGILRENQIYISASQYFHMAHNVTTRLVNSFASLPNIDTAFNRIKADIWGGPDILHCFDRYNKGALCKALPSLPAFIQEAVETITDIAYSSPTIRDFITNLTDWII